MNRRLIAVILVGLILAGCASKPAQPEWSASPGQGVGTSKGETRDPTPEAQFALAPAPLPDRSPQHVQIHGIYMTGWITGSDHFYPLVDYMVESGLNAVVIDVQDDDGYISWETQIPLAREIGANGQKIGNIDERLAYLKQRGIYTIGRVVVYADPLLGSRRPDLAIMGGAFVDSRAIRWPDPYNHEVWAYKVNVAREAAQQGFDEIQFDYIRFPEHRIAGYNYKVPVKQRTDAIEGFLRYAKQELAPYGIFLSADLFGLTTSVDEGDDMEIGQDYAGIAAIVDYVKPMVYPSHYAPGTYGVRDPNLEPGRIVYESLVAAQKRTMMRDVSIHRPWIQDFNYGKVYTAADIEEQIRGLAQAGIYQWILWDPNNRYTRGVDYSVGGGKAGPPGAWRAPYESELAKQRLEAAARAQLHGLLAQ
jgi:hypothetical protein